MLVGGAERQLAYLARAQVELGHTVHVALIREGPTMARLRTSGATVHRLVDHRAWDIRGPLAILRLVDTLRVDVVQTWLTRMDVWGGIAARIAGVPWILSERWSVDPQRTVISRWLDRVLAGASAVVANSESGADRWLPLRKASSVHVVPNGLPADEIAATEPCIPTDLGVPLEAKMLVSIARFSPQKNPDVLAKALGQLLAQRQDVYAICCGEGVSMGDFRREMDAQALSTRCLTPGYRQDVWSLLKSAAAFISTSKVEGRPNAVHEAMLCGCPMVLSDILPHREFVPTDGALWFSPDDPKGAAKAIEAVLDNPAAARERAQRARVAAEGLTVAAMALAYDRVYQSVIAQEPRRTGGGTGRT